MGLSWPSLHTWICMSVLHEAKDSSHFQSTSAHNNQYSFAVRGVDNWNKLAEDSCNSGIFKNRLK